MSAMIFVLAHIEVHEGQRDAFLVEFRKIVPLVRDEVGCIEYAPTVDTATDIPVQQPLRTNIVTVVEKWQTVETLKAHLVAPHMLEYREKVKELVVGSKLHILELA